MSVLLSLQLNCWPNKSQHGLFFLCRHRHVPVSKLCSGGTTPELKLQHLGKLHKFGLELGPCVHHSAQTPVLTFGWWYSVAIERQSLGACNGWLTRIESTYLDTPRMVLEACWKRQHKLAPEEVLSGKKKENLVGMLCLSLNMNFWSKKTWL